MDVNEIENKIKSLPDDLKNEVIDFIDFLIMRRKHKEHGAGFNFNWEGGLSDIKDQYSSVTLQHQASEWR